MKKNQLKKWTLRISVTIVFIIGLLAGIVLKPSLLYAHSTADGTYTIYLQRVLAPQFVGQLNKANELLKASELYDSSLKLSICLNDGSYYPQLIQKLGGTVFGRGFAHEVVLGGEMNAAGNYVQINGYKWNLVELLAHEATHCMEFNRYGLRHSGIFGSKRGQLEVGRLSGICGKKRKGKPQREYHALD